MSTEKTDDGGYVPCQIVDNRFVRPCTSLSGAFDGSSFGKGRALFRMELVNLKTHKPSRSFVVLRMGEHVKRGIVINFCPFCGTRIDAPVSKGDECLEASDSNSLQEASP